MFLSTRAYRTMRPWACLAGCALTLMARTSHAAPGATERALAEALFREGKQLIARGEVALGCNKLEESFRIEPTSGTLLNLATCHDDLGKIATAWAEYQAALGEAKKARRADRVALIERRLKKLEGKVPSVTVEMTQVPPGLVMRLDGVEISAAALGSSLPVDPGKHLIALEAPGYEPHKTSFEIPGPSARKVLKISELKRILETPPPPVEPERPSNAPWVLGFVFAGSSMLAAALGTGFGGRALSLGSDAEVGCPQNACTQEGYDAWKEGKGFAAASNVAWVFAGALAAGAVVTFILAPAESAPWAEYPQGKAAALVALPWAGMDAAGVGVVGAF